MLSAKERMRMHTVLAPILPSMSGISEQTLGLDMKASRALWD